MKHGDPVVVRMIWAGGERTSRAWFRGFAFERDDGPNVLVRKEDGSIVRYPRGDVRTVPSPGDFRRWNAES